jgi:hypothetical protein
VRILLCALAVAVTGCTTAHPTASPRIQQPPLSRTAAPAPTAEVPGLRVAPSQQAAKVVQPASYTPAVRTVTAAQLRYSWRPGCPVSPSSLRALTVRYKNFSGTTATGTLIVHRDAVAAMTAVFADLYRHGFPIRSIRPIDAYKGSDDASAAADNTSSFNCRLAVATGSKSWSQHAYGRAVDVNDVENPYFEGGRVIPPAGRRYADRTNVRPGMAVRGGALVTAFARVGWGWGGRWSSPDYQHFSSNGR